MNQKLIRSSIEFDDIDVSDILTPRIDVAAIDKYASFFRNIKGV